MNVEVRRKIGDPKKYQLNAVKGGTSNDVMMVYVKMLRVIVWSVDLR